MILIDPLEYESYMQRLRLELTPLNSYLIGNTGIHLATPKNDNFDQMYTFREKDHEESGCLCFSPKEAKENAEHELIAFVYEPMYASVGMNCYLET